MKPERFSVRVYGVLRRGGKVLLTRSRFQDVAFVNYPGGGVEFMRAFWNAATALDPDALGLTEDSRFPFCTPNGLTDLVRGAGLQLVDCTPIEVPTVFQDFEDYWRPFTLGAGPAPGYCVNLDPDTQQRLKEKLKNDLPRREDGSIALQARAWALKALVA